MIQEEDPMIRNEKKIKNTGIGNFLNQNFSNINEIRRLFLI